MANAIIQFMIRSPKPRLIHDVLALLSSATSPDKLIATSLTVLSAVLYVTTCAPSVLFGDSGEFQFVPYILGIAHPTGYPLYVILGWLWSHLLPIGNVAYRMNLFSCFWASLTVGLSYFLVRNLIVRTVGGVEPLVTRMAAGIASATFAVTQTFWSQAIIAEVYSLNAFFVVSLLLLLLRWVEMPHYRGLTIALAIGFGLALTHHRTILALLPGILVCAIWSRRGQTSSGNPPSSPQRYTLWRTVVIGTAGVLLPLLLYLYLPLRAPYVPYTVLTLSPEQQLVLYENTGRGMLNHIVGAAFAENLRLGAASASKLTEWAAHLKTVMELLDKQFGLIGICLAFIGVTRMLLGRRWPWLILIALSYTAYVAFNLLYAIGDVEVLYIPSYLLITPLIGIGLVSLTDAASKMKVHHIRHGVILLSLILPVWTFIQNLPRVDRSSDNAAATLWQPILQRPIPFGAILISNDRDEMMPLWYYQYVEGQRGDLLGLFPRIVGDPVYEDIGGVLDEAMGSNRPVFLIKQMQGLEVKVQLENEEEMSPLVKVVGLAANRVPQYQLDDRLSGLVRLIGYDISPPAIHPGNAVIVQLYWEPLQEIQYDYTTFVHLTDEEGNLITQSDHRPGGVYYPTSLWKQGERLLDVHTMALPITVEPGEYRLWVGMYLYPSMQSAGGPIELGRVVVTS